MRTDGARRNRWIALGVIGAMVVVALICPWLVRFSPDMSSGDVLAGPSATYWLGTDDLGRDVFARLLYGARISLLIGPSAALLATMIGVPIGLLSGIAGGTLDLALVQLIDLFISLPSLILALIIVATIGASLPNLILVLGIVMWPQMARMVRAQVLVLRETPFIEAARAVGSSRTRIVVRHLWPNTAHIIGAQFAISTSSAIFTAASLGFLGLGLPPPAPDWGGMVQSGFDYIADNPLLSLAPGAAVTITVFAFYLLGRDSG